MAQLGIIVFEFTAFGSWITGGTHPNFTGVAPFPAIANTYQLLNSYTGITNSSFGNYAGMSSGSWLYPASGAGVGEPDTPSPAVDAFAGNQPNVYTEVGNLGHTWKAYSEDITYWDPASNSIKDFYIGDVGWKTNPDQNAGSGSHAWFVNRHNPGTFYTNISSKPAANATNGLFDFRTPTGAQTWSQGTGTLMDDIAKGTLPDFFTICPNLPNDGHQYTPDGGPSGGVPASINGPPKWLLNTPVFNDGITVGSSNLNFPGYIALLNAMRPGSTLMITVDNAGSGLGQVFAALLGSPYSGLAPWTAPSGTPSHWWLPNSILNFFKGSTGNKMPTTNYGGGALTYAQAAPYTSLTTAQVLPFTSTVAPPPTPPTGVTVGTVTSNSIALSWTAGTDPGGPGIGHYDLYRSTPDNTHYGSPLASPTGTSYTDNTVSPGTTYFYKLKSVDTAGLASTTYSNEVSATTLTASGGLNTSPAANTPGFYSSAVQDVNTMLVPSLFNDVGRVWGEVEVNGVVYVASDCDHTIDNSSGSAVDRSTTPYLAAYRKDTGAVLQTWIPNPNTTCKGLQLSPDSTKIYVWGAFTTIGGQTRHSIAAFPVLTGPTDASAFSLDASLPDINIDGPVNDAVWQTNQAWIVGGFANVGGAAHSGVARLKLTSMVVSQPPVFGFNAGSTVWAQAHSDLGGGFGGWRGYGTPGNGIPASGYPAIASGTPPAGVNFRVISLKPNINPFLAGTYDALFSNYCARATPGDWITLWHEGDSHDVDGQGTALVPSNVVPMHTHAYALAKAANPNIKYGQISTCFAAEPAQGGPPNLAQWLAPGLDFQTGDGYSPVSQTISLVFDNFLTAVRSVDATVPVGITETNSNGTHTTSTSDPTRAAWFHAAYAWAVAHNCVVFFPFFFDQGSVNSQNYDWDSSDTATINELMAEIANSNTVVTSGTWGVDAGFTGSIAGATVINSIKAKSDGSLIVVGGQITDSIQAFNGTTGNTAPWSFNFTATHSQNCLWLTADDSFVLASGDFGGTGTGAGGQSVLTDWTGAGPNTLTGIGTTNAGCYWYVSSDGPQVASAKISLNGLSYAIISHYGDHCSNGKSTLTASTVSKGVAAYRWGNITTDTAIYFNPPNFGGLDP